MVHPVAGTELGQDAAHATARSKAVDSCDGTVEAGLEGDAAVETLIAWMRVGPQRQVTDVVVVEEPSTGEQGFVVR